MAKRVISFTARSKTPSPKPICADPLQLTFLVGGRRHALQVVPNCLELKQKTIKVVMISKTKG